MRRLTVVLALVCSAFVSIAAPTPIHASSEISEPEQIARTQVVQTTGPDSSSLSWGLDRIDQRALPLSGSYSYIATGTGVKAYIVDSGIKADHVQLAGRVVNGWSYRSADQAQINTWRTTLGSCKTPSAESPAYNADDHPFDVDTFDYTSTPNDYGSPDNDGHGTHVAGIIGGTDTGVAKGVTLVPVRVLNSCGEGLTSMVLRGLQWILADHQMGEPAVVNMSIGFDLSSTSIDTAIRSLLAEGVVVVAAAGNSSTTACNTTPAGTPGTISVGASASNDYEASYSNYGECVDLLAPGSSIKSTWHFNNASVNPYKTLTGTSMAAPHVAGIVARYLQGLTTTSTTVSEVATWLLSNTTQNAITFVHTSPPTGEAMTPNKLLAMVVPDAPSGVTAASQSRQLDVSWTAVAGITYVVTSSPGTATCSSSGASCSLTGLSNGVKYSVSVVGSNTFGNSRASVITATPDGVPEPTTSITNTAGSRTIAVAWTHPATDSPGLSFTATASPNGASCTTAERPCTISNVVNGLGYTVTVVATNAFGSSSVTASSVVIPDGEPEVPVSATSIVAKRFITLSWPAVTTSANVTYVVTSMPGNFTCTTTELFCTFDGLTYGINYTFAVTTRTATGQVTAAAITTAVRPGFTVKKTIVKKGSTSLLSSHLTSISTGKKQWSESGPCSIKGTKLIAPKKKTKCVLILKVAKTKKYPAMSTKVTIAVQ